MILKELVVLLITVASLAAQPAQVLILRHGEKPVDPADNDLSLRGRERAAALAYYLDKTAPYTNFGDPAAIFAAKPTDSSPSQRSLETIAPYAERVKNVGVDTPVAADHPEDLVALIRNNAAYNGKTVIVCWTHDEIPLMAKAFGVPRPPLWSATDFSHVWQITFPEGRPARLIRIPQRLLYRDPVR